MAIFPGSVSSNDDLYIAVDSFTTTLNGAIDDTQTTITLTTVTDLPTTGILTIENEKVLYTGIAINDITGCTRGFSSTSAASHADATEVNFNVVEEHHNVLKDEIIAIEQNILDRFGSDPDQILAQDSVAGSPSYSFASEPTTGWMLFSPQTAHFKITGTSKFIINTTSCIVNNALLPISDNSQPLGDAFTRWTELQAVKAKVASGTVSAPGYAFEPQTGTGLYIPTTDTMGLAASGVAAVYVDNNSTATETRFMLWDVDTATMQRVSVGAADSGGVGFKVLRIPN